MSKASRLEKYMSLDNFIAYKGHGFRRKHVSLRCYRMHRRWMDKANKTARHYKRLM